MDAANNSLVEQIEDLAEKEDLGGLERLINSLDAADLEKYRTELKDAAMGIFHFWEYSLVMDKIKKKTRSRLLRISLICYWR